MSPIEHAIKTCPPHPKPGQQPDSSQCKRQICIFLMRYAVREVSWWYCLPDAHRRKWIAIKCVVTAYPGRAKRSREEEAMNRMTQSISRDLLPEGLGAVHTRLWWRLVFLDLSGWPRLLLRLLAVSDVIFFVLFSLLLVFFIPPLCSCYLVVLWLAMT